MCKIPTVMAAKRRRLNRIRKVSGNDSTEQIRSSSSRSEGNSQLQQGQHTTNQQEQNTMTPSSALQQHQGSNGTSASQPERQNEDGQNSRSSQSVPERRTRGPTRMRDIWDLEEGQQIVVSFNVLGQPVGVEGGILSQFLGTMVRKAQLAPIRFPSWKHMPDSFKEEMWKIVERKFQFQPLTERAKRRTFTMMAAKWRRWKCEVKTTAGFDENLSVDENVTQLTNPAVNMEQYRELVQHLLTEKGKLISKKNKQSREKNEEPHTGGTKSIARRVQEEIDKHGVAPSRAHLYITTHTRKDGTAVSEKAAANVELMKQKMATQEKPESALDPNSWDNDTFAQVKGPDNRGRVRGVGQFYQHGNKKDAYIKELEEDNRALVDRLNAVEGRLEDIANFLKQNVPNSNGLDILRGDNSQVHNTRSGQNVPREGLQRSLVASVLEDSEDDYEDID